MRKYFFLLAAPNPVVSLRLANLMAKLFVGGLPLDYTDETLRLLFEPFGAIMESGMLPNHSNSGQRCAFVTYFDQATAGAAVEALNGKHVVQTGTAAIIVRFRQPKEGHRQPQMNQQAPYCGQPASDPSRPSAVNDWVTAMNAQLTGGARPQQPPPPPPPQVHIARLALWRVGYVGGGGWMLG